jgi:uncharacterized repeat protein (TIGR01451 family)
MNWTVQKSKAGRVPRACTRRLMRWGVYLFLLALMSGSALAAGTINYTGLLFVDNGYGGGIAGNGVQEEGELGVGNLNNISVNYTLTNASGATNTGNFNISTNGSGVFTFQINGVPNGYSLTQVVFNRSDNFINAYAISGGTTGSIVGTMTATSAAQVTMTWATGAVPSGSNITGGRIGLIGNTSIGGKVFMNNGPLTGEAANQVQDADEPGFTAFPVAITAAYTDIATGEFITLNLTTSTTTGAYPSFIVPMVTQGITFTVNNTQFNSAGYFINAVTPPANGGTIVIGDQNCSTTTLNGVYGTNTQQYNPCYANLQPSTVMTGTINRNETAINFGAVPFNSLVLTSGSSSQIVAAGTPATYTYQYTSYSSDMKMQFVLTGGTQPKYYIKEASFNNPDCTQPYDVTTTATQYLNWNAQVLPGRVVCIEVIDTPASGFPDQLTLHAIYQYNTTNNPWASAAGSTSSVTSIAGKTVTGTVFVDDGSGAGSLENNGIKETNEALYAAGATITAAYTYIIGGVSTPGSASTITNSSGAFSMLVPANATNVVITRSGWASYIGTGGSGGTSTVHGTYASDITPAAGDTVTIATLSDGVSGIAFGIVELDTLAPNGTLTTSSGNTIYYPHTFTAYTGGKVTLSSSDAHGWTTSVLNDPTCSGIYVSSVTNPVQAAVTYSTATTSTPSILCVLEAVTVPGTATAGTDVATVSASYAYLNGATTVFTYVVTATDTTTVTTTISGLVYIDTDHDGTLDVGETAYSTAPTLYAKLFLSPSGTAVSVVTVTSGIFTFPAQATAGTYTIHLSTNNLLTSSVEIPPPGYVETQNAGGYTFAYTSGGLTGINFGLYSGSKVSGLVFNDNGAGGGVAGDGIQNGSEVGIPGATVSELASSGGTCTTAVCQMTTASDGKFTLYIPSGQALAVLARTATVGYVAVMGKPGTTGGTWAASPEAVTFTPVAGTVYTGVTFGEVYLSVTIVKSANKASVNPGDTIVYTLQYANLSTSTIAIGNLTIVDTVPTNTTFVTAGGSGCGSGTLPAGSGLTACTLTAPAVGGIGNVTWTFTGTLSPNYTGSVTLSVKVK